MLECTVDRHEHNYTGTARWLNAESGEEITISLTQSHEGRASDLVEALTTWAALIARDADLAPVPGVDILGRLN
jgi:hypothetical protein